MRRLVAGAAVMACGLTVAACASAPTTARPVATATVVDPGRTGTGAPPAGSTFAAAGSSVPPAAGTFAPVVALVVQRLDTADAVAASKWTTRQPVSDPAREAAVLAAAADRATQVGADEQYVTAVFVDQIAASKQVQQQLLDGWAADTSSAPTIAPDLATQVRPVLDRITAELVPALAVVQDRRDDPGCAATLADDVRAAVPPATAAGRAALPVAIARLCAAGT